MSTPSIQRLLRTVRSASSYRPPRYRWSVGMLDATGNPNTPFKPACVGRTREEAEAVAQRTEGPQWGGDMGSWDDALRLARVGHRIDFYVYESRLHGDLVTNVGVLIASDHEAFYCETGEAPVALSMRR